MQTLSPRLIGSPNLGQKFNHNMFALLTSPKIVFVIKGIEGARKISIRDKTKRLTQSDIQYTGKLVQSQIVGFFVTRDNMSMILSTFRFKFLRQYFLGSNFLIRPQKYNFKNDLHGVI